MSNWQAKFVKCPFFRNYDPNRIVCEGLEDTGNTINLVFENPLDRTKYMKTVCYDLLGCRDCLLYRALSEKYGESV